MSFNVQGDERKNIYFFAAEFVKKESAAKILDIACGGGEGTALLGRSAPTAQIFGVDIDPMLIAGAEKNFVVSNVHYIAGDARQTPFQNGEFDRIVSFHTIEHFSEADQKKFLSELNRILKSGGKLLIATPDRDVWGLQGIAGMQADHIRELSQREFIDMVSASGFEIEGIYGQSALKSGNFPFRKFLNFLKKIDVFRLRKLLGRGAVNRIDLATQPVRLDAVVRPLTRGERASTTVLVCKKR